MKQFLFPFLFLATALTFAQKGSLPDDVVQAIHSRIEYGTNPSIVVGIIDKNGPQYYSFGSKTVGGEPVNEHTIYEIGSITKVFTAILLADNVVKGKMKVEDPIGKYLPSSVKVPVYPGGGPPIALGNLSDHTSALPPFPTNFVPTNMYNPFEEMTVQHVYDFLSGYELTREVGTKYEYSNLAVGLLGHILALQAKTSYEDQVKKIITSPLKMDETAIVFTDKMKANLAVGHALGLEVGNWDLPTLAGAGAIRSSVYDMLTFLAVNIGLKKSSLDKAIALTQIQRLDLPDSPRMGLGWHIESSGKGDIYWHTGGTGGYRTFAGFIKETGTGVVVFTNSDTGTGDIGLHLLDSEKGLATVKPHVAMVLKKTIDEQGLDGIEEKHLELKENHSGEYDFSENQINILGYQYLGQNNIEAALAVFKINVIEHPESSNVYDSYGEALMKNGQQEEAIVNYKKSLELNPGNSNAIAMLAKMGVAYKTNEVMVSETLLQSYTGTYELAPGFNIVITRKGSQLFGQATGQSEFELFPKTETEFYLKVVEAKIVFSKTSEGVVSMTLYQGGQMLPGKRI